MTTSVRVNFNTAKPTPITATAVNTLDTQNTNITNRDVNAGNLDKNDINAANTAENALVNASRAGRRAGERRVQALVPIPNMGVESSRSLGGEYQEKAQRMSRTTPPGIEKEGKGKGRSKVFMGKGKQEGLPMVRHTSLSQQERPDSVEGEEKLAYYQPTLWWFTSVVFPLIAGTFGPITNLLSICALSQPWREIKATGAHVTDAGWVLALNTTSLVFALAANLLLLFNFARRVPYKLAQPLTILFWYASSFLLVIPIALTHTILLHPGYALSQSYYYAFISTITYFIISTLLLFNLLGTYVFHAYPPSFAQLTMAQRTLMLQTILFSLYLALGAGVFCAIEGWSFNSALYWADYTLLTIGLGSDFPVMKTSGRMLLFPFAAIGIVFVGLVVSSVQRLVLERGKARITKRHLETKRKRWEAIIDGRLATITRERELRKFEKMKRKCFAEAKRLGDEEEEDRIWRRREFELMRYIEMDAAQTQKYIALALSVGVFILVWVGGSIVFWALEKKGAGWTYPQSLYFSYTSILTIGYGDFYPTTNASRPFFVIWSLVAVPAVTVLISNMGQTVVRNVEEATVWLGQRSILPERILSKHREGKKEGRDEEKEAEGMRESGEQGHGKEEEPGEGVEEGVKTQGVEEVDQKAEVGDGVEIEARGATEAISEDGISSTGSLSSGHPTAEVPLPMLMARLAHEISHIARDASERSDTRYTWHEWVRWLKMMDEASKRLGVINGWRVNFGAWSPSRVAVGNEGEEEETESSGQGVGVWRWTWLDDHGPLFSAQTEAQWVLERMCLLLERVAEQGKREEGRECFA